MGNSKKKLQTAMNTRNVDYMKPSGFKDWFTLAEASRECSRDPSWLRKLESENRIPKAKRVKVKSLSVRLWSPQQIEEIKLILSGLRRGRPSSAS